jgi:nitroreductase
MVGWCAEEEAMDGYPALDLLQTIYTTRAVRRFRPDPIPDDVLVRLIEAATRAASGSNAQRWHFVVVRDPELRRRVGELYRAAFEGFYPPERLATESDPQFRRLAAASLHLAEHLGTEPPVLVLVCLLHGPRGIDPPTHVALRRSGASAYPAVQNLLLAARAYGIGGCLTTAHTIREDEVREVLGVPPHVETYALVPLGYPASADAFGPLRRRPVTEVMHADRWGAPFTPAQA